MNKTIVSTSAAPAAIGPYSQGVRVGDLFFFSGMIPIDPATGALVGEDAPAQAEQVCRNIRARLAAASLTPAHIVKTTVFLTDLSAFAAVNEVYARLFDSVPPARSCVEVAALPKGALVEIECVAALCRPPERARPRRARRIMAAAHKNVAEKTNCRNARLTFSG